MNSQMAALSMPVRIWMNWMAFIFLSSVFFVLRDTAARWTLLTFILTMVTAQALFYWAPNVHLFGIVHFLLWVPLLLYLHKARLQGGVYRLKGLYKIWLSALVFTIVVSLLFDARDLVLVAVNAK